MYPPQFSTTRLAHEGCDPSDTWRVVGIGHSKVDMEKVPIVDVQTIAEYDHGCQEHERCLGHICRSPFGMPLPMQSLAVSTSVIKNDIAKAANAAFGGTGQYYSSQHKKILADSMKKKTGRMRKGILNCHIDGSLRMVIGPQEDLATNVVCIPKYLTDKWIVVYFDETTNRYKTRRVQDGDRAIAVRPPSLSIRSVQPVIVAYWDKTYMGISADVLKAFDGDYDGDEMHLYPVYSEEAVRECQEWTNTPNQAFAIAREVYDNSGLQFEEYSIHPLSNRVRSSSSHSTKYSFMYHTTLSFQEIKEGKEQPLMAEQTRTKMEHLVGFRERYNTDLVSENFVSESIRGMADTNAQQLMQSVVGDMARIAKLIASCVIHRQDGVIGVATRSGFHKVCEFEFDIQDGSSCVLPIGVVCAGSQQSALDSHHAKKKSLPEHNVTADMIQGVGDTLVLVDKRLVDSRIRSSLKPKWFDRTPEYTVVLCKPSKSTTLPKSYILGTYNPVVLSTIPESRRLEVCRVAIEAVTRYHSFPFSTTQIMCLAALFSFQVETSEYPITTREGCKARDLRWTEVMMANHYNVLSEMLDKGNIPFAPIETVSSCLMAGNFTEL